MKKAPPDPSEPSIGDLSWRLRPLTAQKGVNDAVAVVLELLVTVEELVVVEELVIVERMWGLLDSVVLLSAKV